VGVASRGRVMRALQAGQWHQHITAVMEPARHIPRVAPSTPLDEVQEKLAQTSSRIAAVYDGWHFKGLITRDDIYRVFSVLAYHRRRRPQTGWTPAG